MVCKPVMDGKTGKPIATISLYQDVPRTRLEQKHTSPSFLFYLFSAGDTLTRERLRTLGPLADGGTTGTNSSVFT